MHARGCCPGDPPEPDFSAAAADLSALSLDPALDECCRRDLQDQAREARCRAQLAPHDRSQQRRRLGQQVFGVAGPPAGEEELDEGEDEVGELERLRQLRLAELQQLVRARQRMQTEGHGVLATVSAGRLLELLGQGASPHVVAHIVYEGDAAGAALDEHLASWAGQYMGTRFVRCVLQPGSGLPRQLDLAPGPALVAFREGAISGRAPLEAFGADDADLKEESIHKWLRRLHVLQHSIENPGSSRHDGRTEADLSSEEEDEPRNPCELCGRRYSHQHIRSVVAHQHGSSSEGE